MFVGSRQLIGTRRAPNEVLLVGASFGTFIVDVGGGNLFQWWELEKTRFVQSRYQCSIKELGIILYPVSSMTSEASLLWFTSFRACSEQKRLLAGQTALTSDMLSQWSCLLPSPSALQDRLQQVKTISSTTSAFAAVLEGGSVLAWGDPDSGGALGPVQDQLQEVQSITSTSGAFAALRADGRLVTWGNELLGGNSREV